MDQIFGDPKIEILERESIVLQELWKYIHTHIHLLISLMKKIVDLDW